MRLKGYCLISLSTLWQSSKGRHDSDINEWMHLKIENDTHFRYRNQNGRRNQRHSINIVLVKISILSLSQEGKRTSSLRHRRNARIENREARVESRATDVATTFFFEAVNAWYTDFLRSPSALSDLKRSRSLPTRSTRAKDSISATMADRTSYVILYGWNICYKKTLQGAYRIGVNIIKTEWCEGKRKEEEGAGATTPGVHMNRTNRRGNKEQRRWEDKRLSKRFKRLREGQKGERRTAAQKHVPAEYINFSASCLSMQLQFQSHE